MIESTWRPGFIYISLKDGMSICRDVDEFLDGRFEEIAKPRPMYSLADKEWHLPDSQKVNPLPGEVPLKPTGPRLVTHRAQLEKYLERRDAPNPTRLVSFKRGEQDGGEEDLGRSGDQSVPPTVA